MSVLMIELLFLLKSPIGIQPEGIDDVVIGGYVNFKLNHILVILLIILSPVFFLPRTVSHEPHQATLLFRLPLRCNWHKTFFRIEIFSTQRYLPSPSKDDLTSICTFLIQTLAYSSFSLYCDNFSVEGSFSIEPGIF